jgi:hypothetical protein
MTYVSRNVLAGLAVAVGMTSSAAFAEPALNRCWGEIASQTAKLSTPDGTNGGGMGQHSRSTSAANINGGFASDSNAFGITFNVKTDGGNAGRQGVGNVSNGIPHVAPGGTVDPSAANGQHAINNSNAGTDDVTTGFFAGGFANFLDPVTGQIADGTQGQLHCSMEDQGGDFTTAP